MIFYQAKSGKLIDCRMSGLKTLASDIGNLLMDPNTSDIEMVCQGEKIKAHKFILTARSPVFSAMLQSNMLESINSKIKIDDADKDVLKEMLRYMYKGEVDKDFTNFKDLLVLADKYQVGELIKDCGTKIVESLNKDNVFEIGNFAEIHNAEELTRECIKFVLKNASDCLNQDWEDQIKECPKMMLQFLKHFLKEHLHTVSSREISRSGQVDYGWKCSFLRATAFQVDSKVRLCGVGMYGSNKFDDFFAVQLKIFYFNESLVDECLLEETKVIKSDGTHVVNKLIFSQPISVEANRKYHITVKYSCRNKCILHGIGYNEVVHSSGEEPFKVTFSASRFDQLNKDDISSGPFPSLYFCK